MIFRRKIILEQKTSHVVLNYMSEVDIAETDQTQNDLLQDNSTGTQNVFLSCSILKTSFFSSYVQSWTRRERKTKVVWAVKVFSTETDEVGK